MVMSMPQVCAAAGEASRKVERVLLQTLARVSQVKGARPANKYADIFEAMKPGQCIVCQSDEAAALSNAMKKWIENTGAKCITKFTTRYVDGKGRVWLLADPAKAKIKVVA